MNPQNDSSTSSDVAPKTMRAMAYDRYGDADVIDEIRTPVPDRSTNEVLIKVHASSVNPIDYRLRSGEMKGLLPGGFPRVPGFDVAGVVVECDAGSAFSKGDRIMAFLDSVRGGACAEFAVCGEDSVAKLPDDMSYEIAAAIPLAGTTAIQSLRDHGEMERSDRVLINGASGGVGMFAVQIAKAADCHVTAVASEENREFCLGLGADEFVNYEAVDFTQLNQQWDLIFDAAGKASYCNARDVMAEKSRYVSTEPDVKGMIMTVLTWPLSKSGKVMLAKPNANDLHELVRLHTEHKMTVTIDQRYDLDSVSEAHRRVEQGVDRGKVVVIH